MTRMIIRKVAIRKAVQEEKAERKVASQARAKVVRANRASPLRLSANKTK